MNRIIPYIITTLEKAYIGIHWNRDAILYMANFRISDISLSFIQGGLGSEVTIVKALSHL